MPTISYSDFEKVDIRSGTVLSAEPFPEGRYSTHILQIDFGSTIGIKKSLAKLAPNYEGPELIGKQVLAVTNFEPKQIGPHRSEVLTLGFNDDQDNVILVHPGKTIQNGQKLH